MRTRLFAALIVAFLAGSNAIAGGPTTLGYQNDHSIEPVLVKVNDRGEITDVLPAYKLSPELTRLLQANLSEMIHTPAIGPDGKPAPTQILMKMALQVEPRGTGTYDAHFVYVSATPLPLGRWYWSRDSFGQLALASPDILAKYPASGGFKPVFPASAVTQTGGGASRAGAGHSH